MKATKVFDEVDNDIIEERSPVDILMPLRFLDMRNCFTRSCGLIQQERMCPST